MNAPKRLHELGQSVWLDSITRDLLTSGTPARYIAELSVTGLTSNPSVFVSRWDAAVAEQVPDALKNRLGIAIGRRCYRAYRDLMSSPRWQRAFDSGARAQRLLLASTGTKDPKASDTLYVSGQAAPLTVDTMPEGTLKALADRGEVEEVMPADGGDCEAVLAQFTNAGIDLEKLAAKLQEDGAASFVKSWNALLAVLASKSAELAKAS